MLTLLEEGSAEFDAALSRLLRRGADDLASVEPSVRRIVDDVRAEGDPAVLRYAERFDGARPDPLFTRDFDGASALARLPPSVAEALRLSAARIRAYHERQVDRGFRYEEDGVTLGQRVRPVGRAGVYAPGGKARYPSSVLMTAIPARVAGVADVVLATPRPNDLLLAAAHLAGVTAVLDAGGAQAIAALAYGTQTVPRADKIVGPGNLFVTAAKRLVFGDVDIDGLAGPSEILVVADETADARVVAADLLSQAEHDEAAYALLLTTDTSLARAVCAEVTRQLEALPRAAIARAAIIANGHALVVRSRPRMLELANALAVEHVALQVARPEEAFERVGAIGAAFVGNTTPEAAGDYLAGPSHVLPTGGAVRFGSPLGVYDFVARTSYIQYTPAALARHAPAITALARAEGLEAHARAVDARITS
ncbi:MAG: histidinol dehydrogenase [Polyangiaceae bacterium]|nr:histidinol dehydrogenase [Polyangiaceae bacterium]